MIHEDRTFYMYLFIYMCMHVDMLEHVWRSKDNLQELVLSFYPVTPEDGTQVIRLVMQDHYLPTASP